MQGLGQDVNALVLDAGSSSLEFCVVQRPAGKGWRLDARGQANEIGSAPKLAVKDEAANEGHGPRISRTDSRVSVWVIPTTEGSGSASCWRRD